MSSSSITANPPWPPYQTYRDCSQAICSIYCPQWCYILRRYFPSVADSDNDFYPVIITVIGMVACFFILFAYCAVKTKYCRRGRGRGRGQINDDPNWTAPPRRPSGLDESVIKLIAVLNYQRGDESVESSDCSVCLGEFQEDEKLRLLPTCRHAFHVPCIDEWLKIHATCPLCRGKIHASAAAGVVVVGFVPQPPPVAAEEEEIRESVAPPIESGDVISGIAVEDLEAGGEESGRKVETECGQFESGGGDQVSISISQLRRSSSLNIAAEAPPLRSISSSSSSSNIVGAMKRSVSMEISVYEVQ